MPFKFSRSDPYYIAHHRMGWAWAPVLSAPSKRLSQIRLHFRQAIGPDMAPRYRPLIYDQAIQLVKSLVDFEGDPAASIET